jgi:hypothetical protein
MICAVMGDSVVRGFIPDGLRSSPLVKESWGCFATHRE